MVVQLIHSKVKKRFSVIQIQGRSNFWCYRMRIKITLSADKSGIIDFNYQHQMQAIIYGFLSRSNPDYAQWLHQQGFVYKKDKRFNLFVFFGITFDGPIKSIRSNSLSGLNSLIRLSDRIPG